MLESCGLEELDYNALKININMTVSLHWSELPYPHYCLVFSSTGKQITIQIKQFKMVRDGGKYKSKDFKAKALFERVLINHAVYFKP